MPRPKHDLAEGFAHFAAADLDDEAKGPRLREALLGLLLAMNPGDMFPSERVLAERFGVARLTVRRVLNDLQENQLLERVPGRGTIVTRPRGLADTLSSFTDMRQWTNATARILGVRRRPATAAERDRLGLSSGQRVIAIHRVRLSDGLPLAVERITMPAERFPDFDRSMVEGRSLYRTLAEKYDAHAFTADQVITVGRAEPAEADLLGVADGDAVMKIVRTTFDNLGQVLDIGDFTCHPERYSLHVRIGLHGVVS